MDGCIELQKALLNTTGIRGFLRELSGLAVRELAADVSCGVTMRPNGRPVTVASTDPVAEQVDGVQYLLGDGPCLHAMRDVEVVSIPDITSDNRWPEFEARAAEAGIKSCLAVPLTGEGGGAVNFYARTVGAFGEQEIRNAEQFAGRASGALALAERIATFADVNGQLRASMASRTAIDTAIGIIIARERCTQTQAFETLRAASQNTNTKLHDLAATVVTSVTGEPVQASPRFDDPSASATVG